jgi:hypothetical protein
MLESKNRAAEIAKIEEFFPKTENDNGRARA